MLKITKRWGEPQANMAQAAPSDRKCKGTQCWPVCLWKHWEGKATGYKCHLAFSFTMLSIKPDRNGEGNILFPLSEVVGSELWQRGSKLGYRARAWESPALTSWSPLSRAPRVPRQMHKALLCRSSAAPLAHTAPGCSRLSPGTRESSWTRQEHLSLHLGTILLWQHSG